MPGHIVPFVLRSSFSLREKEKDFYINSKESDSTIQLLFSVCNCTCRTAYTLMNDMFSLNQILVIYIDYFR